jgi:hypothetical protein
LGGCSDRATVILVLPLELGKHASCPCLGQA